MHHKPDYLRPGRAFLAPVMLGAAMFLAAAPAKAVAPMGDDAELFITGVATASENDNIFLSHANATSSGIFDLVPGLSYEFGKKNSLVTGKLAYSEDFQMFSKSGSQLDYQLANVLFAMKYDDAANKFDLNANYYQADQAQVGIQNLAYLVKRDIYHVDGTDEVGLTAKSSVAVGASYDDTHYHQSGYVDYQYTTVPVNVYFKVEPKLDLSAGFRYRDDSLNNTGGLNGTNYFTNVGARGEFTPSLTGQFNVGYQEEKLDNGRKFDGFGAISNFIYAADPKTTVNFGVSDDFSYSALGQGFRSSGLNLGFNASLTDQWSVNGLAGYNLYHYTTTTQRDNFYSARVGVSYIVNRYLTLSVGYTYSQDDSNILADSFKDDIASISGSLRF